MFSLFRSRFSKGVLPTLRSAQRCQRPQSHRPLHTGESSGPAASNYAAKKSSWSSPTILLLGFIPVFTFALGTWQLQRLQWKINLIDELEGKLQRDAVLLPKRIKCERHLLENGGTLNRCHFKCLRDTRICVSSSLAPRSLGPCTCNATGSPCS